MSSREYNKQYYQANKEQLLAKQRAYYAARTQTISAKKAEYYQRTKEIKKAYVSAYRKANPHKVNALTADYAASKGLRAPKWITKAQRNQIREFYETASNRTKETGVPYEVDHIVPLRGTNVSGLHVPWNLQVLTKSENVKKHNKYENR